MKSMNQAASGGFFMRYKPFIRLYERNRYFAMS